MLQGTDLRTPERRECERCGRRETWSEHDDGWLIDTGGDGRAVGRPHCIHEWDIDGTFSPFG